MSKGPRVGGQRGPSAAHLRGGKQKKRFKNESSEAQAAYHAKINARRAKRKKR